MKKAVLALSTTILLSAILAGCSDNAANSETTTIASTTPAATEAVTEAATTPSETTTIAETSAEEIEEKSEYFTTIATDKTSLGCFTFEGEKGAWAHLINPYNAVSIFNPVSSADMPANTENIIICFNVSGVSEEITAFCGLQAYGSGDDDEELAVWNNDTFNALTGENFDFIISEDGYYEMSVPVARLAAGLDFWEGLDYVSIVEVAFYGAEKIDDEGAYTSEIKDDLSFEFLGIKAD